MELLYHWIVETFQVWPFVLFISGLGGVISARICSFFSLVFSFYPSPLWDLLFAFASTISHTKLKLTPRNISCFQEFFLSSTLSHSNIFWISALGCRTRKLNYSFFALPLFSTSMDYTNIYLGISLNSPAYIFSPLTQSRSPVTFLTQRA